MIVLRNKDTGQKVTQMFEVCPACGMYSEEKTVEPGESFAICPHCQHRIQFHQHALLILTGASGTGKTAVNLALTRQNLSDFIVMESDALWNPHFNTPEDDYRAFRNTWLKLAKDIGQNGHPVMLCGSATPGQFEACPQARYFSAIHYLALVCDDDELERRLKARPAWRKSAKPEFLAAMINYNNWFKQNAGSSEYDLTLLNTSDTPLEETAECVRKWAEARLSS